MPSPIKPATFTSDLSPLTIARMIWRKRLFIVCGSVLLASAGVIGVHSMPSLYKAEAMILVDSQKIPDRYVSSTVNTEVGDRLNSLSGKILTSTGLKKVITDFDLYREDRKKLTEEEILEKMRRDIDIKLEKSWSGSRPGAFHVGFQGRVPETVAGVANRIAGLFVDENLRAREIQAEGTSEFIVTQLHEAKNKLDALELAVSQYKVKHSGALPQQESALVGTLTRLHQDLQANQEAMNRAQQNKVMLENALNLLDASAPARTASGNPATLQKDGNESSVINNSGFAPAPKTSEVLETRLAALLTRYSDSYPAVAELKREIAHARAAEQIQSEREKEKAEKAAAAALQHPVSTAKTTEALRESNPAEFQRRERISAIRAQLMLSNKELTDREGQEKQIRQQVSGLQERVDQLPVREQEMASVTRDYESAKADYRALLDKKLAADMATEMERRQKAERFTVVDPARVPEKPFSPNRPLFYGIAVLFGIGIAAGLAIAREFQTGLLLGEWELPEGVPILGRVPVIRPLTATGKDSASGGVRFAFGLPALRMWRASRNV